MPSIVAEEAPVLETSSADPQVTNSSLLQRVGDLAFALRELLKRDNEIRIIGTRHGEKLYEAAARSGALSSPTRTSSAGLAAR